MEKMDFKKKLKHLYQALAANPVLVEVPALNYLMVDGEGDPNTAPAYAEAIETLFAVSYTLKFMIKKGPSAMDYGVMPLEGLWWADDMAAFARKDKSSWKWTAMIMQPALVSAALVESAVAEVKRKKDPAALSKLRFEAFAEGQCAQILHIGPFSEEGPTIEKLHRFIDARGQRSGKHHEIYLSDIRRAEPSKWKTIIRQPLR